MEWGLCLGSCHHLGAGSDGEPCVLLSPASLYSRYEVDDDWCTSVLQSYKTEHGGQFPWTVGEDMTTEGRRQLAIFLVSDWVLELGKLGCCCVQV
ncbi:hypothetical protein chiPu_0024271 [Chiloscyllium punctatum]|uniref:Uncharacterized protein n=1 Tax=Chiloscyllium punctatum TaxID=137246 RepID=A0A401TCR9_CHIPU|nr:hypothetical protein [Chiloscyllium punctatum]